MRGTHREGKRESLGSRRLSDVVERGEGELNAKAEVEGAEAQGGISEGDTRVVRSAGGGEGGGEGHGAFSPWGGGEGHDM